MRNLGRFWKFRERKRQRERERETDYSGIARVPLYEDLF